MFAMCNLPPLPHRFVRNPRPRYVGPHTLLPSEDGPYILDEDMRRSVSFTENPKRNEIILLGFNQDTKYSIRSKIYLELTQKTPTYSAKSMACKPYQYLTGMGETGSQRWQPFTLILPGHCDHFEA